MAPGRVRTATAILPLWQQATPSSNATDDHIRRSKLPPTAVLEILPPVDSTPLPMVAANRRIALEARAMAHGRRKA